MASSFLISVVFMILEIQRKKAGLEPLPFAQTIILSVAFTTVCWLVTAFVTAPTSREKLISFYKKVHPAGPGWTKIRKEAGVSEADAALHGDHMGKATLGWISGCVVIWSSLFAIGNFLYGRMQPALILSAVFVVSGLVLIYIVNTLWSGKEDLETSQQGAGGSGGTLEESLIQFNVAGACGGIKMKYKIKLRIAGIYPLPFCGHSFCR